MPGSCLPKSFDGKPGMRGVLLDDPAWDIRERIITRAMLENAEDIVVCNSLRGPLRAYLDLPGW
jgi:para-aminobenzoate synthetase/4-amino-4-deoxychorismate lyase